MYDDRYGPWQISKMWAEMKIICVIDDSTDEIVTLNI